MQCLYARISEKMPKIKIVPSILSANLDRLKEEMEEINAIFPSTDRRNIGLAGRRKLESEK